MPNGTVKWFSGAKGFGFITPEGGGNDLFFHHTEIESSVPEGVQTLIADNQSVHYELAEGRKGPQAIAVRAS